jgi:hypothetical protein
MTLRKMVSVGWREVLAAVMGLIAFLLFLPPLLLLAFMATGPGSLDPDGWWLLAIPTVLGVALVVTARRLVVHRY